MKIEMTEKQMDIMREALEFYSRFLSGQVEFVPDELRFRCTDDIFPHTNVKRVTRF
jgi:hypothetical protein